MASSGTGTGVAAVLSFIIRCVSVSALLTIMPGPNTLVIARSALRNRLLAVLAALGTSAGALTWGIAAAVGLAVLLRRFGSVYEAVKLAGAGYLIVLGLVTIWRTIRHKPEGEAGAARSLVAPAGRLGAFQSGYLSDVLNPKTGIFYVAIVPQIIPGWMSPSAGTLLFSSLDALVTGLWFTFVAICVAQFSLRAVTGGVVRMAERITGAVLIGLGVRTLLESR